MHAIPRGMVCVLGEVAAARRCQATAPHVSLAGSHMRTSARRPLRLSPAAEPFWKLAHGRALTAPGPTPGLFPPACTATKAVRAHGRIYTGHRAVEDGWRSPSDRHMSHSDSPVASAPGVHSPERKRCGCVPWGGTSCAEQRRGCCGCDAMRTAECTRRTAALCASCTRSAGTTPSTGCSQSVPSEAEASTLGSTPPCALAALHCFPPAVARRTHVCRRSPAGAAPPQAPSVRQDATFRVRPDRLGTATGPSLSRRRCGWVSPGADVGGPVPAQMWTTAVNLPILCIRIGAARSAATTAPQTLEKYWKIPVGCNTYLTPPSSQVLLRPATDNAVRGADNAAKRTPRPVRSLSLAA